MGKLKPKESKQLALKQALVALRGEPQSILTPESLLLTAALTFWSSFPLEEDHPSLSFSRIHPEPGPVALRSWAGRTSQATEYPSGMVWMLKNKLKRRRRRRRGRGKGRGRIRRRRRRRRRNASTKSKVLLWHDISVARNQSILNIRKRFQLLRYIVYIVIINHWAKYFWIIAFRTGICRLQNFPFPNLLMNAHDSQVMWGRVLIIEEAKQETVVACQ